MTPKVHDWQLIYTQRPKAYEQGKFKRLNQCGKDLQKEISVIYSSRIQRAFKFIHKNRICAPLLKFESKRFEVQT